MYEKKKTGIAVGSCIDSYQCGWNGFCSKRCGFFIRTCAG